MGTTVTFAKRVTMVATELDSASYSTDPFPLGENDRASAIPVIHYGYGPNTPTLNYACMVSNDGIEFVPQGPGADVTNLAAGPKTQHVAAVNGQVMRYDFSFVASGGTAGLAAVCFDLLVHLDVGDPSAT